MPKMLTPDDIRAEMMDLIRDLCIWDCDDESVTRALFYINGAYDLANNLIERMEGKE